MYESGFRGKEGTGVFFVNDFEVKGGYVQTELVVRGHFTWQQSFLDEELSNGTQIDLSRQFGFNVLRFNQADKIKSPSTLINSENGVGTNEDATAELQDIFTGQPNEVFQYSKPKSLIEYLLNMVVMNKKDAIILDSFAGSGTTGHAVFNLNKDGGCRKFILVEMEDYAETLTAERNKRVICGYGEGSKAVEGTGGAFDFYELGEPLFREDGNLNEAVGEDKIREYIFFSETQQNLSERNPKNKYFLGNVFDTAYYFYYEPNALTTLNHETLRQIVKQRAEQYIIYADTCTLTEEEMHLLGVIFKKIPRDIKRF